MAFTRFKDDEARIQKQMEEMTYVGRYQLDVPGPGVNLPFMEDAQLRMQKWGANLQTNAVNLESDLLGLTRPLQRDDVVKNNYKKFAASTAQQNYPNLQPFIEESRASLPAWTFRDREQTRWETPMNDPQSHLEIPFTHNQLTRTMAKDEYRRSHS
jgi:hypothetical protein